MRYRSELLASVARDRVAAGSGSAPATVNTTENLTLGRGKLYFTPYAPNTTTGGVKGYFGNTPTLTMTQQVTKLDHYSMEGGLKVKDKSITLQTDVMLTFETDNISPGNLLLWFGGEAAGQLPPDAPTGLGTLAFIGSASQVYGSLTFESDNPVGENMNYWFPYVCITPTGNVALKGDAWQTLSFQVEALQRDNVAKRVYGFLPANNQSTAAADTSTPQFTPQTAAVATETGALVTVSGPANGVHGTSLNITTAVGAGAGSYFLNIGESGQTYQTAGIALTAGQTTTTAFTPATAGNYVATVSTDAAGADVVDSSSTIVVS